MRISTALLLAVLLAGSALASCPGADCVAGGGPAATDCFIAFTGIPSTTVSCTDGDPGCDTDGKVDGACTLALQACVNVSGLPSCTPGTPGGPPTVKPAKDPAAQQLAAALQGLTQGCTPPGLRIPLKVSLAGIKPGKSRLTVTATSGGKRDRDKLKLTCLPSAAGPSLSAAVQPIFGLSRSDPNGLCTYSGCHSGPSPGGALNLEPARTYAELVGVKANEVPKYLRVKPGSIRSSFLARKILGLGIPPNTGSRMPQGCPAVIPPVIRCPTDAEIFTILSWIANGAPNN
jgi:hypothetical protein